MENREEIKAMDAGGRPGGELKRPHEIAMAVQSC